MFSKKVLITKRPFRSGCANMTPINRNFDSSRTGFEDREVTTPHNKKQEKNSCRHTRTSRTCLNFRMFPAFRLAPLRLPLHPSVLCMLTKEMKKSSRRASSCVSLFACTSRVARNPKVVRVCTAAGSPEFPEYMAAGRHRLNSRTQHTIGMTLLELRRWPHLFLRACSSASTRRDFRISCRDTPASFSAKTRGAPRIFCR
jgi:hypothetical protein